MNSKGKTVLRLALLSTIIYFLVQYFVYRIGGRVPTIKYTTILHFKSQNDQEKFLVNTAGCKIPVTKIMPDYYVQKWGQTKPSRSVPDCSGRQKFFSLDTTGDDEVIKFDEFNNSTSSSCGLWEVQRHPDTDNDFKTVHLGPVTQPVVNVSSLEMFMVKCNDNYNYEAHIPRKKMKPDVLQKIEYWQQQQGEGRHLEKTQKHQPISILAFGTDSTSRSHVYRSLENSVKMMRNLGFIDFQGYHSVYPATLENFDAFLMGLTHTEMRATCADSWSSPFDQCPLVWKLFDRHKYVTLFLEDGTGTFNWGGQSGFKEKEPTDYYPKPLFKVMMKNQEETDCVSTETVPQFAFRYLRQFLKTFSGTPTFSLTWLNVPFHEDDNGLPSLDDDFENFLGHLKSSPDILNRTLIIYLGDHGDRSHLAGSSSIEGYIERSLPPLFLRIPDILTENYPELKINAEINRKKLTSAFDLHHTLLHTLALSGLDIDENILAKNFNPILNDRSSLFSKIFDNRTCSLIHVDKGFCVCNSTEESKSLDNPYMGSRIHSYVLNQLNLIVSASKYKQVCKRLDKPLETDLSAKIIDEGDTYSSIIFNFNTDELSTFEVRLKIVYENSSRTDVNHFELLSDFTRTNRYGDQSWCVGFESDEDKRMKTICSCKKDKPKNYDDEETTMTNDNKGESQENNIS